MQGIYLSAEELDALYGLPLLARELYVFGIRPQMDIKTGKVGVYSDVSWNGLARLLRVEGAPGIKGELATRSKLRRAGDHLVRRGLVVLESEGLTLIFSCLKARLIQSAQNKVINKPANQPDHVLFNLDVPESIVNKGFEGYCDHKADHKADTSKQAKADQYQSTEIKPTTESNPREANFGMFAQWEPSPLFADLCRRSGVDPQSDVVKQSVGPFIAYYMSHPSRQGNAAKWDGLFIKWVVREGARYGSGRRERSGKQGEKLSTVDRQHAAAEEYLARLERESEGAADAGEVVASYE